MKDTNKNQLFVELTLEEAAVINGGRRGRGKDDGPEHLGRRGRGRDDGPNHQ
jgi:hypothetical protein